MKRLAIIVFLLFSNTPLHAQWFQASASASIADGNINKARERAIRKAVKDTLLFSGTSLSNLQQLDHSPIVDNRLRLNSKSEIKALHIINEVTQDDILTIKIKVDIDPKKQQCIATQFPKSLSVARFSNNVPSQTVFGQIYNLHKKTGEILFNELSLSPYLLNIRSYIDMPLKLGEKYNNKNLVDTLRSLSIQSDSQFIVFGEINDLSINFKSKNPERYFYLTIYLYDALQGQLVFSKQYRQKAIWEYEKEEKVDTNSKQFWENQYGESILHSLDQVNADITQRIQCSTPKARIVAVDSNIAQINLGKKNGLTKGTKINLSYANNYKDQYGIERTTSTISKQEMEVIEAYEQSAILSTLDNFPLSNIQIDDIADIIPLK